MLSVVSYCHVTTSDVNLSNVLDLSQSVFFLSQSPCSRSPTPMVAGLTMTAMVVDDKDTNLSDQQKSIICLVIHMTNTSSSSPSSTPQQLHFHDHIPAVSLYTLHFTSMKLTTSVLLGPRSTQSLNFLCPLVHEVEEVTEEEKEINANKLTPSKHPLILFSERLYTGMHTVALYNSFIYLYEAETKF